MNVLVIGGTGFLSSAVAEELLAAGHAVTLFTRGRRPLPEALAAAGVRTLAGDRKDADAFVQALQGHAFEAVVDCICYTPDEARADLRAFAGRVGHLLMISTDFVYGPRRVLPIDEDTPTLAMSQYGRNKTACEELLLEAWREERFPATVLRPPHIMGAGGQLGTGSLQGRDPALLDRLQQRAPVVLLDAGTLLIQPVVHRDIGRACAAALGKGATYGQCYNVAGPDCVTTREYYDLVAAVLGMEEVEYLSLPSAVYVRAYPERAPFAHHRMYSLEKLARETGYRPDTTLRHAIFETIDAIGCRERDGRTVWGEPYVETEQERRIIEACRSFEGDAAAALSGTPE
jgi:nucleoside-diphosphate-sugar epimerase